MPFLRVKQGIAFNFTYTTKVLLVLLLAACLVAAKPRMTGKNLGQIVISTSLSFLDSRLGSNFYRIYAIDSFFIKAIISSYIKNVSKRRKCVVIIVPLSIILGTLEIIGLESNER